MGGAGLLLFLTLSLRPAHEELDLQIARVTKDIEARPDRAELHLKRGELHRLHEDWAAAKADFDRAEKLDPGLAAVDLARGRMWLGIGDPKEARKCLDRVLAREPGRPDALVERARALVRLGQRAAAVEDYTRAVSTPAPSDPEIFLERSQAQSADGRVEEALRGLDEGIRRLGPLVTLQLAAIDLELGAKRTDAALARLDSIAAKSERKDPWLARRGEILREAGRRDEAREAFRGALKAVESLPPFRRQAKATLDLEKRVRAALEAVDEKR